MCSFAVLLAMRSVLPLLLAPVGALRGLSVGVNGALHVQGQNVLYSLDKNGALLWQFEVSCIDSHWWGTDCLLQHAEGVNGTVYLTVLSGNRSSSPSGSLIALDGSDGVMKWNYTVAGLGDAFTHEMLGDIEVGADGTVYMKICSSTYCHGKGMQTVAVSSDGSPKWAFESFNPWHMTNASVILREDKPATLGVDGTVFLHGPEERSLYSVRSEDGTVKWHQQNFKRIAAHQSVVDKDGTVFALPLPESEESERHSSDFTDSTSLMALSGEDGSVLWEVAVNLTWGAEMHIGEELIYVNHMRSLPSVRDDCELRAYHRSGTEAWTKPCFDTSVCVTNHRPQT